MLQLALNQGRLTHQNLVNVAEHGDTLPERDRAMSELFDPNCPDAICAGTPPHWCISGYQATPHSRLEERFLDAERDHDRRCASLFVQIDALLRGGASKLLCQHGLRQSVLRKQDQLMRMCPKPHRTALRRLLIAFQKSEQELRAEVASVAGALARLHRYWWPQQAELFKDTYAFLAVMTNRTHWNPKFNKWPSGPRRQRYISGMQLLAMGETTALGRRLKWLYGKRPTSSATPDHPAR